MSANKEELFFSYADYCIWNEIPFVTLGEFIYLINGFEPLGRKLHDLVIPDSDRYGLQEYFDDFTIDKLNDFKSSWKKIVRLGYELPIESDAQTDVRFLKDNLPHYEAIFLIEWATSKKIKINAAYSPIESEMRKTRRVQNLIDRQIMSCDEFVQVLALYNPNQDVGYFRMMLINAIEAQILIPIYQAHKTYNELEAFNCQFKTELLIEYATQMKWNFPEKFYNNKSGKNLRCFFNDRDIMIDGIVDVRQIKSTKLVLAIENYITNMRQDPKKIPSTESVKQDLILKYGKDGVTDSMARIIDECSRHDSRANNPPTDARKKTIFFQ